MKPIDTKATDSSQPSEDSPTSSAQVPTTCSSDQTQANKKKASDSNSIQESRSNPEISPHDVLFGRGGGTNRHTGNIHFRDLVSSKQPAYVQARKMDKTLIAKSIVAHVRGKNGRFLKNEKGKWVDVGDKKATEKTSQALREGLSDRMREVVKEGGVGLSKLKQIGYCVYGDTITRGGVQKRVRSYESETQQRTGGYTSNSKDERKPAASRK
jgi:hypothetical protein